MADLSVFPFDLSDIDESNKWNYIRAGIEIGVTQGFTRTDTASLLRDIGLSFSDAPFRRLYDDIVGFQNQFEYAAGLPLYVKPNPELIPQGKFPITAEYGYVGQVKGIIAETGEEFSRTFRLDSNSLMSRIVATERLQNFALQYEDELEGVVGDIEYIGMFKNPQ